MNNWESFLNEIGGTDIAFSVFSAQNKFLDSQGGKEASLRDGLRKGTLLVFGSCRSGVRTKARINMGLTEESEGFRLSEEGRTGPGATASSQESPWGSVVGPRQ